MQTEDRLRDLEARVQDIATDLRVLRALTSQDHGSALNKIRYITEKVLHRLCAEHDVSWGKSEPTLENMIGPLVARQVIPKSVALHVRTVQNNASPGSHYQEDALRDTHVRIAEIALIELLEWYYRRNGGAEPLPAAAPAGEAPPPPSVEARPPKRMALVGVVTAVGVGALAVVIALRGRATAPSPAPSVVAAASAAPEPPAVLREPQIGNDAVRVYREPKGAESSALASPSWWEAAATDFEKAAQQPGAPVRWRAGHAFAAGRAHLLRERIDEAIETLSKAVALEPGWSVPHTSLASALGRKGKLEEALASAREAQRLEPSWPGAIASTARVYAVAGKLDDAIQEYRRALAAVPTDAVLLSDLALVYHAARLDGEAERYARRALDLDDELVAAHLLLAERALERGDAKEALREATRAAAIDPRSAPTRLALADALALAKKRDEALDAYRHALDLAGQAIPAGCSAERFELVRKAVGKNELPPARNAAPVPGRTSAMPKRSAVRSYDPQF
jgi:tetratricopeptide (TPR) repeat protein